MRYNCIYFVSNTQKFNSSVKGVCTAENLDLHCEVNFGQLISKIYIKRPHLLILDYTDYMQNEKCMKLFTNDSPFYVPTVLILSNLVEERLGNLPNNYAYITEENLQFALKELIREYENVGLKTFDLGHLLHNNREDIYNTLLELGFNPATNGTSFLRECINQIMLINCKPVSLNKTIYAMVAKMSETNLASVARCMKSALDNTWKRKNNHKIITKLGGASFEDFLECPTTKEFIYYLSNKLHTFYQKQILENKLK